VTQADVDAAAAAVAQALAVLAPPEGPEAARTAPPVSKAVTP
jgi:hypothetical protein